MIVSNPTPGMSKSIVLVPLTARSESRIAWRSDPGPPSAVVVTVESAARDDDRDLGLDRRGTLRLRVQAQPGGALVARRRGVRQPGQRRVDRRERTAVGQRAGPIAGAGQAGGGREAQRPGGDRERQVPWQIQRPGFRVLQGDPIARRGREAHRLAGGHTDGLDGHHQIARAQGRDLGGVALRVDRRGREDRQTGRRREGDREGHRPGRVGRLLERPQVVLGLPGAAGSVPGAGEDVDAIGRVRLADPQPALGLAVGGREKDREVLEVIGALPRTVPLSVTPSSPRSMAWPVLPKMRLPVI